MCIIDVLRLLLIFDIVSHRLTASLIELFLWEGSPVPRHRVLTSFAERMSGFKITDATELEDIEPQIPLELSRKIQDYQPIHGLDRLLRNGPDSQCNIFFIVAWTNQKFDRSAYDPIPGRHS